MEDKDGKLLASVTNLWGGVTVGGGTAIFCLYYTSQICLYFKSAVKGQKDGSVCKGAAKPDDLTVISGALMAEENYLLQVTF